MKIPYGTRLLLVTTTAPEDRQFGGIVRACRELGGRATCHHAAFAGQPLDLRCRRKLTWTVISGHGGQNAARVGDGLMKDDARPVTPNDLSLPPASYLMLLSCHQGRNAQRALWSRGTGVPGTRVLGCTGETESALSTLFLLHILAEGPARLLYWFERWVEINELLRPHFPLARRIYQQNHGRMLDTLTSLQERVDTSRFSDFLSLAGEYKHYLDALA